MLYRNHKDDGDITKHIFTEIITAVVFFMVLFIFLQQIEIIVLAEFNKPKVEVLQRFVKSDIDSSFTREVGAGRVPTVEVDPANPLIQKIILDDRVLRFASGKADLETRHDREVLALVGRILLENAPVYEALKVEGHADTMKINAATAYRYPTNWELSSARASTVVRYLTETLGYDPHKVSAVGFSSYHPRSRASHPDSLRLNRRIEFVVRYSYADSLVHSQRATEIYEEIEHMQAEEKPNGLKSRLDNAEHN